MEPLRLEPGSTALIVIDLQRGILERATEPHSAAAVLSQTVRLAEAARRSGTLVVLVRAVPSPDGGDRLAPPADLPLGRPGPLPQDYAELPPELGPRPGDILITKRQWGAFYGTELDLQLRRRGVRTLILAGIATNYGIESTARDAYERGFAQIFAEDAMSGIGAGAHGFAVTTVFPRIGRVRATADILAALSA
ncbi:MAG TPA: hydrolase [Gemmatimonadales bacterium]|nr:hydrolase [Gemmatimonadales bacterium]